LKEPNNTPSNVASDLKEPGNTPLVKVGEIYVKLECTNPCGSIKDRIAKYILEESEKKGLLKPGMQIVEATSGNTGIALSYYARQKGYPITIIMPENMTDERKKIIKDLGAKLILCSAGNFAEAAAIRDEMAQDTVYFNPDQFSNHLNIECHNKTTGQEILSQIKPYSDQIDAFIAGIGTGGSLIGVAQALKEKHPNIYIATVEPSESAVMSGGKPGNHDIQGIGDGFIPAIANNGNNQPHEIIDQVFSFSSAEAINCAKEIKSKYGYCVGISSGANYLASLELKEKFKTVVTIFADGYAKYKAHGLKPVDDGHCQYKTTPFGFD